MKKLSVKLLVLLFVLVSLVLSAVSCTDADGTTAAETTAASTDAETTVEGGLDSEEETTEETTSETQAPYVEIYDSTVSGTNYSTSGRAKNSSSLFYYNKYYKTGPYVGDPYLFYDNGVFYLYGTTRLYVNPGKTVEQFEVYTSTDLVNWEDGGACFIPDANDWCTSRLWAPEVYKIGDKYYMYYTAAKGGSGVLHGSVAVADSPLGPFTNDVADGIDGSEPIFDFGSDFPTIDGSVFTDDDGRMYYFFVRDQIGDNASSGGTNSTARSTLWGIELENAYTVKEGAVPVKLTEVGRSTLTEKGAYTQRWETQQGMWNEGPFVLKHDGKYYLTYSANYFGSKYYAVGYAVSDSPLGSYEKPDNLPIMGIDPNEDSNWSYFDGTGHAMFLTIGDELYVVYHTLMPEKSNYRHFTIDSVGFRDDGTLYINGPTVSAQNLPAAVTGVQNVAGLAAVTAENIISGVEYLNDGQINASLVYKQYEAVGGAGKVTLTFTFDTPQDVIGVMVYNSADYATSFTKVTNIQIGEYYSFDSVRVLSDSIDASKEAIYAGSCAILELNKAVKVYSVTVTIESDTPVSISEIKILAKTGE